MNTFVIQNNQIFASSISNRDSNGITRCSTDFLFEPSPIKPNLSPVKEKHKPTIKRTRILSGTLLNGVNVVMYDDIAYNVDPSCLNTRQHTKRYNINFDGVTYSDSEGFSTHSNLFRPFKPGKVRGKLVLVDNVKMFNILRNE